MDHLHFDFCQLPLFLNLAPLRYQGASNKTMTSLAVRAYRHPQYFLKNHWPREGHTSPFTSVFQKCGWNFSFQKNVEFLEFFGFTLCFRTFQAKKFFSKFFRLIEKFITKSRSFSLGLGKITAYQSEHFGLENFTSVFSKIGGKF